MRADNKIGNVAPGRDPIASHEHEWTVCLTAEMCVRGADQVYAEFPTRRSALLLARLALAPKRTFSRNALAEMLWPDEHAEATRPLLRNELFRLKRSLGLASDLVTAPGGIDPDCRSNEKRGCISRSNSEQVSEMRSCDRSWKAVRRSIWIQRLISRCALNSVSTAFQTRLRTQKREIPEGQLSERQISYGIKNL
jgi:hypothetical protein